MGTEVVDFSFLLHVSVCTALCNPSNEIFMQLSFLRVKVAREPGVFYVLTFS